MNKKQYEEKRAKLLAAAQALIEAGKIDDANKKMAEISELDAAFQAAAKAMANLQAMQNAPAAIESYGNGDAFGQEAAAGANMYDSIEYRTS